MKVYQAIAGFPRYQITSDGQVLSLCGIAPRVLKQLRLPNGYDQVVLCESGKKQPVSVHRLVANAFVPNPLKLPHVNHRDGVKHHNLWSNLEWVSQSENVRHAYRTGLRVINSAHRERAAGLGRSKRALGVEAIHSIRSEFTGKRGQLTFLGKKHGVHRSVIADVVNGITYGDLQ